MIAIKPIDEQLKSLHKPVITTVEDDIDSALDGFRVTHSGSVMVPTGQTKPFMTQRSASSASTMSSSYSSTMSYPSPADPYHGYYAGSLPRSLPSSYSQISPPLNAFPRSLPAYSTSPASLPHQYNNWQMGMSPQMAFHHPQQQHYAHYQQW